MNNKHAYIIFIFTIIIFFYLYWPNKQYKYEYKTWYQCKKGDSVTRLFHNVLRKHNMHRTYGNNWDICLSCNSDYSEKGFRQKLISHPHQIVAYVSRNAVLGSKEYIWKMIVKYFGREEACKIMPRSYIFPKDQKIFDLEYSPNKTYVLKSEAQRQKGLKLSNNYTDVTNSRKNGYKIVQEYIGNSLTYNGYKINFRIYLLVICGDKMEGYIFNDGIVSYTKEKNSGELSFDSAVASFYTSRSLYDKNYPIIISELKKKINYLNYDLIFDQFKDKTNKILKAASSHLGQHKLPYNNKTFQVFGIDFLVTKNYDVSVLEINIGPGMVPYNKKDEKMRMKFHEDCLSKVGIININEPCDLIKVL